MNETVRVLVVEDDPALRGILQELLSAQGHQVVAAARGEEALARARDERFDLIVADIRMDGINGLDTIEQARELQPDIGSIVVSGYASEEETLRAVKLNVAGYLKKPFKLPDLLELINKFLSDRRQKLSHTHEITAVREAFLWSLERMGGWAEKVHPGRVTRAAELARGMARVSGFSDQLSRQLSVGAVLRSLQELDEQPLPGPVRTVLASFPLLHAAQQADAPAELATVALQLCRALGPEDPWPTTEELPASLEPRWRKAYNDFLFSESPEGEEPAVALPGLSGILSLGRTLEHGGDWAGAASAYAEAVSAGGISHQMVQALFGQARVAVAQGQTATIEQSVSKALSLAQEMGPVTLALTELEGAEVLRRAGHPAALKLFERAVKSLSSVNLVGPWACAVLALQALRDNRDPASIADAVRHLDTRSHQPEVLEQIDTLLPDLLELCAAVANEQLLSFTSNLMRDYSQEVVGQLRRGRLTLAARLTLLDLLQKQGTSLSEQLLEILSQDPDEQVRTRCLALGAKLGSAPATPLLRVYSLGSWEVSVGDQRIDDKSWNTRKTKYLFARLVESAPRSLSVEQVTEEFWPGSEESSRNNLNTAVSWIRRHLKVVGDDSFDPILRVAGTMVLNPALPLWHDLDELTKAALSAQSSLEAGNKEAALGDFGRMARLYRGPYLEGCYMDWAVERRTWMENRVAEALEQLALHRLSAHRYRESLEHAFRLLGMQAENTQAHDIVMQAYIGLQEHDKAVAHFDKYKAKLARETGEEPATELLRSYQMARYGFAQNPGFTGA